MSGLEEMGRNIRLLRKASGLPQLDLALLAGVSLSRLQEIENGCSNVTVETLWRLSKALGVDSRILGIFTLPDQTILAETYKKSLLLLSSEPVYDSRPYYETIILMRNAAGLTQKQLAISSNVSVARIRDIEHGCANPTTGTLLDITGALDMSLIDLNVTVPKQELMSAIREARDRARYPGC